MEKFAQSDRLHNALAIVIAVMSRKTNLIDLSAAGKCLSILRC